MEVTRSFVLPYFPNETSLKNMKEEIEILIEKHGERSLLKIFPEKMPVTNSYTGFVAARLEERR